MSNTGTKIGSNRDMNKDHKKLPPSESVKAGSVAHAAPKMRKGTDKPVKDHTVNQHDNSRMVSEEHSDEKLAIALLIVGAGLIAYQFC